MKKLIALPLLCLCLSLAAQSDSVPNLYHGIATGSNYNRFLYNSDCASFSLGYYADILLKGRFWLFTRFNFDLYNEKFETTDAPFGKPLTTTNKRRFIDFEMPVKLAIQTGKKSAKLLVYPCIGAGLYFPLYYYFAYYTNGVKTEQEQGYRGEEYINAPVYFTANAGIEAKWRYSTRHHIALGFSLNYVFNAEYGVPMYNTAYLKFGWNKYKKEKKKAE